LIDLTISVRCDYGSCRAKDSESDASADRCCEALASRGWLLIRDCTTLFWPLTDTLPDTRQIVGTMHDWYGGHSAVCKNHVEDALAKWAWVRLRRRPEGSPRRIRWAIRSAR
jgi:hypothetical protein